MSKDMMDFYKGKRVLVTGHTGFKGTWMCRALLRVGAIVTGYSLLPPTDPAVYTMADVDSHIHSVIGDIRDLKHLKKVFEEARPEIVIHMAAQPIVRTSYEEPVYTYETNVMGTVNVLECVRLFPCVRSVVNVTTDKVYLNEEGRREAFIEDEPLMGWDPYSNSKSCSELVTYSYLHSFLEEASGTGRAVSVSTARAGNVIGGGDFAKDRIIPDCYRAVSEGQPIVIRNPYSIRPFQHVLEPVMTYLLIAMSQYEDAGLAGCYNVGPEEADCKCAGDLAQMFCDCWGEGAEWIDRYDGGPKEASFLKLDCSRLEKVYGWKRRWNIERTMELTAEWYRIYRKGGDVVACMDRQIEEYINVQ